MILAWSFSSCLLFLQVPAGDDLDQLRYWQQQPKDHQETLENLAHLYLRAGQWKTAEEAILARRDLGPSTAHLELYAGDLAFWQGRPDLALAAYARSLALTAEPALRSNLNARVEAAKQEQNYRNSVEVATRQARWVGWGSVLLLLLAPLVFIQRKSPQKQ